MTSLTDSSGSLSSSLHISEHCEEETIKEAEAILRATGRRDINFITRIAPVALHGETVDVSTMYIGNDGLQILASFISRNLRIKILNMSNNKVNNDTVILLCRLFKQEIRDYIKLISAGRKTGSYDITLGSHMRYNLDLLNLSNNPDLSLAGGMALHSLLKEKLVRVKELKLENTNIPSSLKTKILKLLRSKDEFTPLVHQPSTKSELTMDSQLNLSFQTSFAIGKSSPPAQAARSRHEKNTIRDLRHRLEDIRNSQGTYRAMRVPFADNDWSVMQVAVVAAGSLFASEVQLLVEDIFRSLNKMLDTFRISLQPLIVDYCKSGSTFENLVDDIHSSPFLSIFFIGDRPGDEKRGNISSLYRLYKEATESCAFVLVAKRRRSTALDLPPALIPLFTLDEYYHQLDPYAETMSTTVDGLPADKAAYFHSFHEKFLESLFKYFPIPGLLANDYPATFDYVDEKGIVHLKGLSVFREMVYQRLMVLFSSVVSFDDKERMKAARRHKEGALFNQIELRKESVELHELLQRAFREQMAAKTSFSPFYLPFSGGTFEQIIRKLYKYLIDRLKTSVLVLEGKELNFMTSQLMSLLCARNLEKLLENNFRIVSYTSRYTALSEEPGDLRDMLIHLIGQITSNETILAYAHREIDVFRLQSVFQQMISGQFPVEGGATLIVAVDGVDKLRPPVSPCDALALDENGVSIWGEEDALQASLLSASTITNDQTNLRDIAAMGANRARTAAYQKAVATVHFIPTKISKNIRFIVTCATESLCCRALKNRGEHSTEVIDVQEEIANKLETAGYMYKFEGRIFDPTNLTNAGITLSDEDKDIIAAKLSAAPSDEELIVYLWSALSLRSEDGQTEGTTEFLRDFPDNSAEAARRTYLKVREEIGRPATALLFGILRSCRWSISLSALRTLIGFDNSAKFNYMLRLLRPVLEIPLLAEVLAENTLFSKVCIASRSFLDVLARAELKQDTKTFDADQRTWHTVIANYYFSIVVDIMKKEMDNNIVFPTKSSTPAERQAAKELLYHLQCSGQWNMVDTIVLSFPFIMIMCRNGLLYQLLRDLTVAFNKRYELYRLGDRSVLGNSEAQGTTTTLLPGTLPQPLQRMKQYILFIKNRAIFLSEFPHLVIQTALNDAVVYPILYQDVGVHLNVYNHIDLPDMFVCGFFVKILTDLNSTHDDEISAIQYLTRHNYVVSSARNNLLRWCGLTSDTIGQKAIARAVDMQSPVQRVVQCDTGAYIMVLTEDRLIRVFDAATSKLVSTCKDGSGVAINFDPIEEMCFSSRGRYLYVATSNLNLFVFVTEKGELLDVLYGEEFFPEGYEFGDIYGTKHSFHLLPHYGREEENILLTVVDKYLIGWVLELHTEEDNFEGSSPVSWRCSRWLFHELDYTVESAMWFRSQLKRSTDLENTPPYLGLKEVILCVPDHRLYMDAISLQEGRCVQRFMWTQVQQTQLGDELSTMINNTVSMQNEVSIFNDGAGGGEQRKVKLVALSPDAECVAAAFSDGMIAIFHSKCAQRMQGEYMTIQKAVEWIDGFSHEEDKSILFLSFCKSYGTLLAATSHLVRYWGLMHQEGELDPLCPIITRKVHGELVCKEEVCAVAVQPPFVSVNPFKNKDLPLNGSKNVHTLFKTNEMDDDTRQFYALPDLVIGDVCGRISFYSLWKK